MIDIARKRRSIHRLRRLYTRRQNGQSMIKSQESTHEKSHSILLFMNQRLSRRKRSYQLQDQNRNHVLHLSRRESRRANQWVGVRSLIWDPFQEHQSRFIRQTMKIVYCLSNMFMTTLCSGNINLSCMVSDNPQDSKSGISIIPLNRQASPTVIYHHLRTCLESLRFRRLTTRL